MQQLNTATSAQDLTREQQALSRGPVVLDLNDFKFVSGGSPKGTWGASGAEYIDSPDSIDSPKGTW